ncbi:MAG: glycosyltransferase family 39 protein [Calditrichia bacterium]
MKIRFLNKIEWTADRRNIVFLILVGVLIRFWGITYGLPSVYNSTEYFIAKNALSLGARHTLEPLNFIYPTFYSYLIAAVYGIYFIFGKIVGWFPGSADFALQFFSDPSSFYLLGRSLSAIAIIISLVVFYRNVRFLLAPGLSLLLTLLLLSSFNIHNFTFWMVPDAFLILGSAVVLYYMTKACYHPLSRIEILLASLVCGFTISTKYNAGFLAFGWLLSLLIFAEQKGEGRKFRIATAALFVGIGFIIGSPYWILSFSKFAEGFRTIWSQSVYGYNFQTGLPYLWEIKTLITSEWLLGLLFIVLLASLLLRPGRFALPIAMIVLPTFLIVGSWEKKGLDYMLIIFPALLVLSAYWISRISMHLKNPKILYALLLPVLLINVPRIVYTDFLHTRTDTRELAGRWIMEHLPPNSAIVYDHYHYDINLIDVNRFMEYGAGSRYLSPAVRKKLKSLQDAPYNYNFISVQKSLNENDLPDTLKSVLDGDPFIRENLTHPHKSLQELINDGARILILNSDTYLKFLNNPAPALNNPLREDFLSRQRFYREIFRTQKPAKVFFPAWNRPGPIIQLFELKEDNS